MLIKVNFVADTNQNLHIEILPETRMRTHPHNTRPRNGSSKAKSFPKASASLTFLPHAKKFQNRIYKGPIGRNLNTVNP